MEEIFVPLKVKNFEDFKISNYGRMLSAKGKIMKLVMIAGTLRYDIKKRKGGQVVARMARWSAAQLVYAHFAEKAPKGKSHIRYKDGDPTNLRIDNLELAVKEPTQEQIDIYTKDILACVKHAVAHSGYYDARKRGIDIDNVIAESCYRIWRHLAWYNTKYSFYGFCKRYVEYVYLTELQSIKNVVYVEKFFFA